MQGDILYHHDGGLSIEYTPSIAHIDISKKEWGLMDRGPGNDISDGLTLRRDKRPEEAGNPPVATAFRAL
jgi:hypothetical protein